MKRLLLFTALAALLYASRLEAAATGCGFPTTLDTFTDVVSGQLLTAGAYNKIQCAVEKLESRPAIPRVLANARPSSPASGEVIVITNAASSTDCGTTGGGTNKVTCQYNGTAWEAIGGGGSSSPSGSTTEVQFRLAGAFSSDSTFTFDNVNQILKALKLELGNVATNSLTLDTSAITGSKTYTAARNVAGDIALTTGTLPTGNYAKFDSSGRIIDGGSSSATSVNVRAYNSVDLTIPTATFTALTLNSERWDSHNLHSTATNTGRITFTDSRSCTVIGNVAFAGPTTPTGTRGAYLRLNGTTYIGSFQVNANDASGDDTVLSPVTNYNFVNTDYVELVVYQSQGTDLAVNAFAQQSPELVVMCT